MVKIDTEGDTAEGAVRKQCEIMTKKQWKMIFAVLLAGSVLAALKQIFFDYTMDEEYQLMMGYRTLRGDSLFKEMWEPHQTSAFLCTGLMWLYRTVTGTYTGILLYLRFCTTLIQAGISVCVYRVLSRLLERRYAERCYAERYYALLCALIYFNMVPKIIQIPDFSNMQVWFFTLTVLCLMQYELCRDRNQQDRAWLVFAAGVWMALEVLAYPSCVILFPFFLLYLYGHSGHKKWRDMGIFTGACAVSALVWLCLVLRNVTLEELLRNVGFVLDFDPTHDISGATGRKLWGISLTLRIEGRFLFWTLLLSLPGSILVRRKHQEWSRRQCLPVFLTIALFSSECIQLWMWAVKKSGYEVYQIHLFLLLLAGLLVWRQAGALRRYIGGGIAGTWLSLAAVVYLSDLAMFYAVPHGIFGIVLCAVLLALSLREALGGASERWICFLLASLCLVSIFGKGYTLREGRNYTVVPDTESIMKCGPAVGVLSDYMNCYIYNCNCEDYAAYVGRDDVVLIVSNMVTSAGTTPYMMVEAQVAHYSIVDPTSYDERLLTYWELYPEKRPNVIVVDCWYGELQENPDSWIMQYIENDFGYSQVNDGRYVRFYRK